MEINETESIVVLETEVEESESFEVLESVSESDSEDQEIILLDEGAIEQLASFLAAQISPMSEYTETDQSVGSTQLSYFRAILAKHPFSDYVIFRDGQYSTRLIFGDLDLSGTRFTGSGTVVTYYTQQSVTNPAHVTITTDSNVRLTGNLLYTYSNLGDYPSAVDTLSFYPLMLGVCVYVLSKMFIRWWSYGKNRRRPTSGYNVVE